MARQKFIRKIHARGWRWSKTLFAPPGEPAVVPPVERDDFAQVINAVYQGVLGRPADPSGLVTYAEFLRNMGLAAGVPVMVKSLFASTEFATRMSEHVLVAFGPRAHRLVNGRKIVHVASLGTHCLSSNCMKKFHLKRYSLPFDWIFSSPETVLHCLENDFAELLDPQHFVTLPNDPKTGESRANHTLYRRLHGVDCMFAHRDPSNREDLLYLTRTVERFRRLLASPEAKLFVMVVRPYFSALKTFPALSAKLRALTPNSAFICIQLHPPTNQAGCHAMNLVQADGDHAIYAFAPSAEDLGPIFGEAIDDLAILGLVGQYAMNLAPDI